jgi:hypothetical protein
MGRVALRLELSALFSEGTACCAPPDVYCEGQRESEARKKVGKNIETLLRGWCSISGEDLSELDGAANARLN